MTTRSPADKPELIAVTLVSTGPVDGSITAINSGLSAGERVVTDGTDRLRDGVKVIVAGEAGGTSGGASGQGRASGERSGRSQNQPPPGNK